MLIYQFWLFLQEVPTIALRLFLSKIVIERKIMLMEGAMIDGFNSWIFYEKFRLEPE